VTLAHDLTLDPRNYVDREEHQALLREMVARRAQERVLLIVDGSGQGKSDLMARLRLNCLEDENRPAVLFSDVRDVSAAFGVLERSFGDARNRAAYRDHFRGFAEEYERWTRTTYVELGGRGVSVQVDANNARVAANASVIGTQVIGTPAGVGSAAAQLSVLDAFQRDLEAHRERVLVIMIDHYNRAEPPVREWINETLLHPCLEGDLPNVIMVLASTPDRSPSYAQRLRDRVAERPLTRLQDDPRLVRDLLRAHRIVGDDEDDEDLVRLSIDMLARFKISEVLSFYRRNQVADDGT
jgi:hypothetical protein